MGRKVGDEGTVDRRTDEHKKKVTGTPKTQQREKRDTNHLSRFVDLILLHPPW